MVSNKLLQKVQNVLKYCDNLLRKKEMNRHKKEGRFNHLDGHCYGKRSSFPRRIIGSTTHWFLYGDFHNHFLDPTAGQFGKDSIPYHEARCCGFLIQKPSKRARILIDRFYEPCYIERQME